MLPTQDQLEEARRYLERDCWEYGRPDLMCVVTAYFMRFAFDLRINGGWPHRENGQPCGEYGYRRANGTFCFHYWNEHRGRIIDLTAGQFGDEPIVLAKAGDPRYVPVPRYKLDPYVHDRQGGWEIGRVWARTWRDMRPPTQNEERADAGIPLSAR